MTILTRCLSFAKLVQARFIQTRCQQVAGSLTYTTMLSIVPLLTVMIVFFSNFPGFAKFGEDIRQFMLDNLLPEKAGQIVATYALEFSDKATKLTLMGAGGLVVSALLLALTIDRVFNQIWAVPKPRSIMARLTTYWFALTLGPVVLGASLAATTYIISASASLIGNYRFVTMLSAVVVPILLLAIFFAVLFYAIPNHPVRVWHAVIGGVLTALLFSAMQRGLGAVVAKSTSYTLVYGAFAALPIFLLWLYSSWIVILLGAVVTACLPAYGEEIRQAPKFPGDRAWSAIAVLKGLYRALLTGKPGNTGELANEANLTLEECEMILEEMMDAGWIVRTDNGLWTLSRSPEKLMLRDVVERFALYPAKWASQHWSPSLAEAAARISEGLSEADMPLSRFFEGSTPAGFAGKNANT